MAKLTPPSISERWQRVPRAIKMVLLWAVIVLALGLLVWPLFAGWWARWKYETNRITTDAQAVEALKEAQIVKGQMQQLSADLEVLKNDYEETKKQMAQLEDDLAAAKGRTRSAVAVHSGARKRQAAFKPRTDAGALSDDALRRDAGAAGEAVKPE